VPHPAPTRLGVVVSDSDYGHSSHPVAGWQFPSVISIWLNLTATALTSACRHSNTRSTAGSPTTAALSTEGRVDESRDNHATGSLLVSLNLIIDDHEGVRDGQVDGGEASGLAERLLLQSCSISGWASVATTTWPRRSARRWPESNASTSTISVSAPSMVTRPC
jgi:hypothetical protein